jgi:hypothetical protein
MKARRPSFLIGVIVFIMMGTVIGVVPSEGVTAAEGFKFKILDVPLYAQQTPKWCWAAGGEMIMTYLGQEVPQYIQVNHVSGRMDCCQIPRPGSCKETNSYPDYENYGFQYECSDGALEWDKLVEQLDALRPVGFSWEHTDLHKKSGGHYMVVRGYILLGDVKLVVINDPSPWSKCKCQGGTLKIISYGDYVEYPGRYTHGYDDYDFKRINTHSKQGR